MDPPVSNCNYGIELLGRSIRIQILLQAKLPSECFAPTLKSGNNSPRFISYHFPSSTDSNASKWAGLSLLANWRSEALPASRSGRAV